MRNVVAVRLAAITAVTLAVVTACSSPASETPPSTNEITALFTEWNDALATGDPDTVAALYAPDAVLIPTLSDQVRTDHAGIVDYFVGFLPIRPSAVIQQSVVSVLDADAAIDAGVYRFTLHKTDVPETVDARFTFVYQKQDGRWLIVNHHSSEMPQE